MFSPRDVLVKIANQIIPSRRTHVAVTKANQAASEKFNDLKQEMQDLKSEITILENQASIDSQLFDLTAAGLSLDEITHKLISTNLNGQDWTKLQSLAQNLIENPITAKSGWLAKARLLAVRRFHNAAFEIFSEIGHSSSIAAAPLEFFATTLRLDPSLAVASIDALAANASAQQLVELSKIAAGVQNPNALQELLARIDSELLSPGDQIVLARLSEFATFKKSEFIADIHFAVFDYKSIELEKSSKNIGDYTQSIATLSHLTRFADIDFVGEPELLGVLDLVRNRQKPPNLIKTNPIKVSIQTAHRDNSNWEIFKPDTWIMSNGWFLHTPFEGEPDFPFNPNLNPIFVSFNVTDSSMLTDAAVEYLKAHSPIGCRDWRTTYLLRSRGISAFFSGCITTTIGQVFSKPKKPQAKTVIQVDAHKTQRPPKGYQVTTAKQELESVREISFAEGVNAAFALLESYEKFELIQTSRLHSYLPSRAIGYKVELRPNYMADPRFDGLLNLTDSEFEVMRSNLNLKLETILKKILSGASKADVYTHWQEICAPDLVATEAKLAMPVILPKSSIDVEETVSYVKQTKESFGNVSPSNDHLQLGFALDQNLVKYLPTVLKSIESHTKATADVHVFCRGFNSYLLEQMSQKFERFNFHFYSFDSVDYGDNVKTLRHITVSTMDRLIVPELLQDLDKLIYLDTDILVRADLLELNAIEFGNSVLMGKASTSDVWSDLTKLTLLASKKMNFDLAANFQREMLITKDVSNTRPINAGVIVMNLKAMRRDEFTKNHLYLVEHCNLNDQDVLNIYAGQRILQLPLEWNFIPSQDVCESPKIVHWAGPAKPWHSRKVVFQEEFQAHLDWVERNFKF